METIKVLLLLIKNLINPREYNFIEYNIIWGGGGVNEYNIIWALTNTI